MANKTTYNDGSLIYADVTNKVGSGIPGVSFWRCEVDFSRLGSLVVTDTVDVFHLPAGSLVELAAMEVLTSCSASSTLQLGGAVANDLIAATAADSAANTQTIGAGAALYSGGNYIGPKVYSATQTIQAKVAGATIASVGKVRFTIRVTQV